MALVPQQIPINLGVGLDTKTDNKTDPNFSHAELENAVFTQKGGLFKRWGFQSLNANSNVFSSATLAASPGLTAANSLATFNDQLLEIGSGFASVYQPSSKSWGNGARMLNLGVSARVVAESPIASLTNPDAATLNGVTLYAYEWQGGVWYQVVDESNRAVYAGPLTVGTGNRPRCCAAGQYLYLFWVDGSNNLNWERINYHTPTSISGQTTIAAIGGGLYSVRPYGNDMVLAYLNSGSTAIITTFLGADGTLGKANGVVWGTGSITPATVPSALNVAVCGSHVLTSYAYNAGGGNWPISAAAYAQDMTVSRADTIVVTVTTGQVVQLTATSFIGDISARLFYEVAAAGGVNSLTHQVRKVLVSVTATTSNGDSAFYRSVGLLTDAFIGPNATPAVGLVYDSATQPTAFFADQNWDVFAHALPSSCGGLPTNNHLSSVFRTVYPNPTSAQTILPDKWGCAVAGKGYVQSNAANPARVAFQFKNLCRITLDSTVEKGRSAQMGQNLHVVGGTVYNFDGAANTHPIGNNAVTAEHGFLLYPEQPTASTTAIGVTLKQAHKASTTVQQSVVTFPADITSADSLPTSCASQIRAGSYVILYGDTPTHRCYVWFNAAGSGSDPSLAGFDAAIQVTLSSSDNQLAVATKFAQAINNAMLTDANGAYLTASLQSDNSVLVSETAASANTANPGVSVPDTQFGIATLTAGNVSTKQWTRFTCPAATWITGGQYFVLYAAPDGTTLTQQTAAAFYFVKDGVGPSPQVPNVFSNVSIAIASTDTPAQVATKVGNAIVATTRSALTLWTQVVSGPVLDITDNYNGTAAFAYNGNVGGITGTVGNATGAGSRTYYVVYSQLDNRGQIHRSAPSPALFVTVPAMGDQTGSGGALGPTQAYVTTTVTAPTLRVTHKSVSIDIYRTPMSGSAAYKLTSIANNPAVDTVSFTDTTADTDLLSGELLYTSGGALPNMAPPACTLMTTWQNRVLISGMNDPYADPFSVWYSKGWSPGNGVAFSPPLSFRVDQQGGPITALWVQDEKLIIAKRNRLYFMVGDGPDDTGANNNFSAPQVINTDVGCIAPESVCFTPLGTFFQAEKGIYLLDRSLQAKYVGAPVERYNGQTITSANLLPTVSQIRFTFSSLYDSTLVGGLTYDYVMDQWSTITNNLAQHAIILNGAYYYVAADGTVRQETPGSYLDNGAPYSVRVVTTWFKTAGVQGLQRIWNAYLLMEYRSAHHLRVRVAYDYDPTTWADLSFDATTAFGTNLFGSTSPFGTGYFGGLQEGTNYQVRAFLPRERCTAIRFEISDIGPNNTGESFQLNNLTLLCGMESNSPTLGGAKTMQ